VGWGDAVDSVALCWPDAEFDASEPTLWVFNLIGGMRQRHIVQVAERGGFAMPGDTVCIDRG
jgi:hypothetical protein